MRDDAKEKEMSKRMIMDASTTKDMDGNPSSSRMCPVCKKVFEHFNRMFETEETDMLKHVIARHGAIAKFNTDTDYVTWKKVYSHTVYIPEIDTLYDIIG